MPEAGYLPIPKKLASAGVKDMMRLSDARMSGTAFGSVILHVSPDSASGGPLALVENGDRIRVSVSNRSVDLLVDEKTLAARRAKLPPAPPQATRGHSWLHDQFMTQAEEGCDFSFLKKEGVTSSP
jgi:dihydroxy-acid dehydratase